MEASSCPICTETYSDTTRKAVTCAKCSKSACRVCVAHYITTSEEDACCMACKHPWPRQFLAGNMTKHFMSHDYRDIRERIILDRERSLLPTALPYIRAAQRIEEHKTELNILEIDLKAINVAIDANCRALNSAEREQKEVNTYLKRVNVKHRNEIKARNTKLRGAHYNRESNRQHYLRRIRHEKRFLNALHGADPGDNGDFGGTDSDTDPEVVTPKTASFVTRGHCPAPGCNSFIEENWSCVVCKTKVCPTCLEILPVEVPIVVPDTTDQMTHVCNKDVVASVHLIRKECKPCPSCRVRVFRVEGCAQMWCTSCNTAFSWSTGALLVDVQYFHNPHHAEWLASHPVTTTQPPQPACGTHVTTRLIYRVCCRMKESDFHHRSLGRILINANEILDQNNNRNYRYDEEKDMRAARIQFVSNEIDEELFKQTIQRIEKRYAKKAEVNNVYVMFATVCHETLTRFCRRKITANEAYQTIMEELRPFAKTSITEIVTWYGSKATTTLFAKLEPLERNQLYAWMTYVCDDPDWVDTGL